MAKAINKIMTEEFKTGMWRRNKGKKHIYVIGEKNGYVMYYIAKKNPISRIGLLYAPYTFTKLKRPKKCTVLHLKTSYWWLGGEQLGVPIAEADKEMEVHVKEKYQVIQLNDDITFSAK